MAIVRPFRGLRPKPDMAAQVASPPYDVLSSDEAREMARDKPYSFLRVNKPDLNFPADADPYRHDVYERGRQELERLVNEGVMLRDDSPCFYLYRLTMNNRSQTGLIALTSCEEYLAGKIKKHEHTRPDKVNDRANHIETVGAQVGPVFSTFRSSREITKIFSRVTQSPPEVDFTADDGVRHELWVVSDSATIDEIAGGFAQLPCLYIADGHHRSEAGAEVCRRMREKNPNHTGRELYNFFLNVLFADTELNILAYNRVVKDLHGLALHEFVDRIGERFAVAPNDGEVVPGRPHRFGIYCEKQWFLLEARDGTFDTLHPTRSIDASILADNLIEPVLGISNPRTDDRIDFVGGIRGTSELVKLVDSGKFKIAFSLYPTSIQQLLAVADAGEVMPPKSTWFEPKLRSGMVVNLLTE